MSTGKGAVQVLRGKLRNRPLAADRFKRNLGLEVGRKPSAGPHAGSYFSSGGPPYAPVSETGTTHYPIFMIISDATSFHDLSLVFLIRSSSERL